MQELNKLTCFTFLIKDNLDAEFEYRMSYYIERIRITAISIISPSPLLLTAPYHQQYTCNFLRDVLLNVKE